MKFRFYHQLESVDCGPACLRMIAAHYGKYYTLSELKQFCNVTRLGITMQDIVSGAKQIGLETSPVKATLEQLLAVPKPCILFWRQEHYVVLYDIKQGKDNDTVFFIADPAYGKIQISQDVFEKEWLNNESKGVVVVLQPGEGFQSLQPASLPAHTRIKSLLAFLHTAIQGHTPKFIRAFLLFCIALVTNWLMPILFQKIIDQGVVLKNMHVVSIFLLAQFMLFLGNVFSDYFSSKILLNISFKVGIQLLSNFLYKLIRLPVSFFDTRLNTDLLQRIEDQDRIQGFITYRLIGFLFSFFNLIAFSAIMLGYNLPSFLIFLVFSSATIGWTLLFLKKRKVLDYSRFSVIAENRSNLYELVAGMPEIKINTAQLYKVQKWKETQEKLNKIVLEALHLNYHQVFGTNLFNKSKDIIITGLCAYLVINDQMSLGIMMSISYIVGQLSRPVDQMVDFVRSLQDAKLSYDRMDEITQKPDEKPTTILPLKPSIQEGIFLKDVSFKYEGNYNPYVLHNLSMTIPTGMVTAIVGASGSGKTTLLKLLLGFYHPEQGGVFLDSIPMTHLDPDQWRSRCGVVMQDGFIFSGRIVENIAVADENYDIERLQFAIETACLDDFVYKLPMGIHTKIGKAGLDLSGGQRQRILIARAIYKNPDFIFFDEATSSLDANNERKIMNHMENFFQGKTVVVIAHRLSTVRNADQIIVLDKGRIVEIGCHDELVEKKNYYFSLVKNQLELGN